MIKVVLNGKPRELADDLRIDTMLDFLSIDPRTVAVARNGDVVPRDRYADVHVCDGDVLEVVRMVGGG